MSNINEEELEQIIKEAKFKKIDVNPFNSDCYFKWEYKDYLVTVRNKNIVLEKEGKKVDISEEQKEKLLAEFSKD